VSNFSGSGRELEKEVNPSAYDQEKLTFSMAFLPSQRNGRSNQRAPIQRIERTRKVKLNSLEFPFYSKKIGRQKRERIRKVEKRRSQHSPRARNRRSSPL